MVCMNLCIFVWYDVFFVCGMEKMIVCKLVDCKVILKVWVMLY